MKNQFKMVTLLAALLLPACAGLNNQTGAHTPPAGSSEWNAILAATRHAYSRHGKKNAVLDVASLKVHNGWAWIQVNPAPQMGASITSRSLDYCKRRHRNGPSWNGCPHRKEQTTKSISRT